MKNMINFNDAALVTGGGFLDFLQMSDEDRASFDELERRYWDLYRGRWKGTTSDAAWSAIVNEMRNRMDFLLQKYAA